MQLEGRSGVWAYWERMMRSKCGQISEGLARGEVVASIISWSPVHSLCCQLPEPKLCISALYILYRYRIPPSTVLVRSSAPEAGMSNVISFRE